MLTNVYVNFAQTAMKIPHYFGQPLERHFAQLVYRKSLAKYTIHVMS